MPVAIDEAVVRADTGPVPCDQVWLSAKSRGLRRWLDGEGGVTGIAAILQQERVYIFSWLVVSVKPRKTRINSRYKNGPKRGQRQQFF